ncbi:class I SAM-dependent methyltransferase [Paenibacillus silviterrae]|uniref:class I SAM-dependent methyltransferase n=1 Tax=Paenibacillus silviterrae TaxID=3242194 RepID=UPI002543ABB3|nr:class I SAM-dependent methyltransferase [Paenibacillus chinjuensis]
MQVAEALKDLIKNQLIHNRYKSIFYLDNEGNSPLTATNETLFFLKQYRLDFIQWFKATTSNELQRTITYISKACIASLLQANQYIHLSKSDQFQLERLYHNSIEAIYQCIKKLNLPNEHIMDCFHDHYHRLRLFLIQSNGKDLFETYKSNPEIPFVINSEYTARFQLQILGLGLNDISTPILDIGCGREANLVRYLHRQHKEAYGLDRRERSYKYVITGDWLTMDYGLDCWGTITSHMAFTNHFHHHHLRNDGRYADYARMFMHILHSLKIDGCFAYSPSLPFVEKIIAQDNRFRIITTTIHNRLSSTRIYRIK